MPRPVAQVGSLCLSVLSMLSGAKKKVSRTHQREEREQRLETAR